MLYRDRRKKAKEQKVSPYRSSCCRHTVAQGCHRGSVSCGRSFFLPSGAFVESRITKGRDVKPRHIASATVLEVVVTLSASLHRVSQLWDPNVRLVTQRSSVDHPWFSNRVALMCLPSTPQRALLHPILLQEPVHRHFTSPVLHTSKSFSAHDRARALPLRNRAP